MDLTQSRYTIDENIEPLDLSGSIRIHQTEDPIRGNYSYVYRGMYNHQEVAIKVIKGVGATHAIRRKMQRERTVWCQMHHPNVVPFLGFAEGDRVFEPFGALISPWYSNGDAANFLQSYGDRMTLLQRLKLWEGVIEGVSYLHSFEPVLAHGDLKPANILIDDNCVPRICDFGLVRIISEGEPTGMTTTTEHTGTDRYLAYELATKQDPWPTAKSDIWALGCIGLEFLFLQLTYSGMRTTIRRSFTQDIRDGIKPGIRPPELDETSAFLWNLLEACWESDPNLRPHSWEIKYNIYNQILGDLSVSTQPSGLHHLSFLNSVKNLQVKQNIPGEFNRWEFNPDGTRLATLGDQGLIQIFQVIQYDETKISALHTFRSIGKISTRISWSFNGKWLLVEGPHWFQVWSQDGKLKADVYNLSLGTSFQWLPKSEYILSTASDRLIELDMKGKIRKTHHFTTCIHNCAITNDGERMLILTAAIGQPAGEFADTIEVYNLDEEEIESEFPGLSGARLVKLSRNGQFALIESHPLSGRIRVLQVEKTEDILKINILNNSTYSSPDTSEDYQFVDFAGPGDEFIISALPNGLIFLWDRESGHLLHSFGTRHSDCDNVHMSWHHDSKSPILAIGCHHGIRIYRSFISAEDTP